MFWHTARFRIDLSRPRVMGIVNVTPDSFSDGGQHASTAAALAHCERLLREGADILDIGGESSRPGSAPLPLEDELARVLPVVRAAVRLGVPVSVDTYKPRVMQAVLDLGADIVNDIWALRQPGAAQVVAAHPDCGVCLMHMHGDPQTMQLAPMQGDAPLQVLLFLELQARNIQRLGVEKARIALDPGVGFGKTVEQNFALLARQRELLATGHPLLVGWSRKSALGAVTDLPVQERLAPSVAAALLAVERGAHMVRVHDVRATVAAFAVWRALCQADRHSQEMILGACRTLGVESENAPQRGQFLPDSQPHSGAMGQEDGKKWAAAAHSQPTIPKSDRLLDTAVDRSKPAPKPYVD